jgi:hypothetical protein
MGNIENIDNIESQQLDEIMNDIAADFVNIPEILKIWVMIPMCRYFPVVQNL